MAVAHEKLGEEEEGILLAQSALAIYEQIEDPNAGKVRKWLEEKRKSK